MVIWYTECMIDPVPDLTEQQRKALSDSDGVVQGSSFILMSTDVVLDWFGYSTEELHSKLRPASEQVRRGEVTECNLQEFLNEMRSSAK